MATRDYKRSRLVPVLYPALALSLAAAFLPSALRPPPEQTSDSAALNPNAPPDDNSPQIIQALRQASGGAGGAQTEATTTTLPAKRPLASGKCFGNPPRQTESVYSAACAPAFSGNNGGATAHNVFPNEVRWGFWHTLGAPSAGRVPDQPTPGESSENRTFRVLDTYFNERYQTYGRHVAFYGLTGSTNPAADEAEAKKADSEYGLFGAYHLDLSFCRPFAQNTGPVWCNPQPADVYNELQPNFWSFMIDRTSAAGFGAEFVCKKLPQGPGTTAKFSGTEKNKPRKISVVTELTPDDGMPPGVYNDALQKECGETYQGKSFELNGGSDSTGAVGAVTQMRASGVTTVVLEMNVVNLVFLMAAAEAVNWQPEWVIINAFGLDFNTVGTILPPNEASHLFGLSAWEVPQRFEETECYEAYKEIDPDNEPDATTCQLFWHIMVLLMDGIQNAGPDLTPKTFQQGEYKLGIRYPVEPWAIGGGFGPGDQSYMKNVGEVWFDLGAQNPENGGVGAYVWDFDAKRFTRGNLPTDDSQLFHHGVTTPGGAEINR